jgi:hypothetical protein
LVQELRRGILPRSHCKGECMIGAIDLRLVFMLMKFKGWDPGTVLPEGTLTSPQSSSKTTMSKLLL